MVQMDLLTKVVPIIFVIAFILKMIIYRNEGKDERGLLIFNESYRITLTILAAALTAIIVLDSYLNFSITIYKNVITLSLMGSLLIGNLSLLWLRKKY
jgi:tellurite resistance protein TehA-like permease